MNSNQNVNSIQKTARTAGVLYLLIAISAAIAHFYVPSQLIVSGDAAATANQIMTNLPLFRLGIGSRFVYLLSEIVVSVLLYILLRPVSKTLSLVAAVSRLAMTTIHGLNLLNQFIVLLIFGGTAYLTVFEPAQLNALGMLFLEASDYGFQIGIVFFALHTAILGYLIYKSRYFPKILGVLFIIASVGYFIDSYSILLAHLYTDTPAYISMTIALAEIAFPLWLLIKGVRSEQWKKRVQESSEYNPRPSDSGPGFEPAPAGQLLTEAKPRG